MTAARFMQPRWRPVYWVSRSIDPPCSTCTFNLVGFPFRDSTTRKDAIKYTRRLRSALVSITDSRPRGPGTSCLARSHLTVLQHWAKPSLNDLNNHFIATSMIAYSKQLKAKSRSSWVGQWPSKASKLNRCTNMQGGGIETTRST